MTDIECYGAYVLNLETHQVIRILSKTTLLASGGAGHLYSTTTNPPIATGDGVAMVYRAKGVIENMEFVQFHPTSLYNPGETPFLSDHGSHEGFWRRFSKTSWVKSS